MTFINRVEECIPFIRESIRTTVLDQLTIWFAALDQATRSVGQKALEITFKKQQKILELLQEGGNASKASDLDFLNDDTGDLFYLILENQELDLDFTPLYQAIHIHAMLNRKNEIKDMFERERLVLSFHFTIRATLKKV